MADPSPTSPDARLFEEHRAFLTAHCYRMLGSIAEAEDAVQETMIRALRAADGFEGRSSLRTWLGRIATRVCLDALGGRRRRALSMEFGPANDIDGPLTTLPHSYFVEPVPDALVTPPDADPSEATALKQSIRLAFVAALQHLPPRQRAALLLAEVLDWPASEIAESLEVSTAAVNSMLQRARATLRSRDEEVASEPLPEAESALLERYVDAFERYDIDALLTVVHEDATMSMPPYPIWLQGHETIRYWMLGPGIECRGSRLIPTTANGLPAFGQYRRAKSGDGHEPWSLIVLEPRDGAIASITHFLDTETLFPHFGLPPRLPAIDLRTRFFRNPPMSRGRLGRPWEQTPSFKEAPMKPTRPRKLFVNLPVRDLDRSVEFFKKLGFEFDPQFTDETATCMLVGEDACVMLLTEATFRQFTKNPICDTSTHTEGLFTFSVGSREEVDSIVKTAVAAGGKVARDPLDHGFIYQWAFYDLDGHHWETIWMDPAAAQ